MMNRLFTIAVLLAAGSCAWPSFQAGEKLKSGPQRDDLLPGAFQPLNLNGPFAGRHHCLVCEFRLNPVALVFVKALANGIDPDVKKLLESLDKTAVEKHDDTGLQAFVVFLTADARSGVTEDRPGDPEKIIEETKSREKLVVGLAEYAKSFKRLIVTCYPEDNIAAPYKLSPKAEVTLLLYSRHRVFESHAFAEGQLKQEGIDKVLQGANAMLESLKKGPQLNGKN